MTRAEIIDYLNGKDEKQLFARSSEVRRDIFADEIYYRGLIEFSNVCRCDCLYCGIRRSNCTVGRYTMTVDEVIDTAQKGVNDGFRAFVLQGGELRSEEFTERVEKMVRGIKALGSDIVITLSCGEQSREVYRRWKDAGADKYLLRIESSTESLFEKIHPKEVVYSDRKACIDSLVELDYMAGSGIMIGLPYQTIENLADDLIFLSSNGLRMCGMGPYIEHSSTPLSLVESEYSKEERVVLTLRAIAILRVMNPEFNIAASTALGTLSADGRKRALSIGANVLMPNITPRRYNEHYALYEGKVLL